MWNQRDIHSFLITVRYDRLYPLFYTVITLGLHHDEALALYWTDVDLKRHTLEVSRYYSMRRNGSFVIKEYRGPHKRRTIKLPPSALNCFGEQFHRQNLERGRVEAWGNPYLMFTTAIGTPLRPDQVQRTLDESCERAGLEPLSLADLQLAHLALA